MKINAYIATLPERRDMLSKTMHSLLPQVDGVHVRIGTDSMGDANKFYYADSFDGYVFICDDDLYYPPDYVEYMISKIEQYNRKYVISLHGRTFLKDKIESYYTGKQNRVFCLLQNDKDRLMQICGTGVTAFHSDTVSLSMNDFKSRNMADVWFAMACERQGIGRMVVESPLGYLESFKPENSIARSMRDNDQKQIEAVNSIEWKTYKIGQLV